MIQTTMVRFPGLVAESNVPHTNPNVGKSTLVGHWPLVRLDGMTHHMKDIMMVLDTCIKL